MSLTEYAQCGVPLAVLVPWASQRFVLTPGVLSVPGIGRAQVWTVGELNDLLKSCGHSPVKVLDALVIFASAPASSS
jgi:hypothetical protein